MRSKRLLIGMLVLCAAFQIPLAATSQGSETMSTQVSIEFAYSKEAYTITATASAGGIITPAGTQAVAAGADFTFSFTPASGYHFAGLRIDGATFTARADTNAFRFERVLDDHTIHVEFAADVEEAKATPTPTPSPTPSPTPTGSPARTATAAPTATGALTTAAPTTRISSGGGSSRSTGQATPVPSPSQTPSASPGARATQAPWADLPIIETMPRNLGISPD